MSPDVCHQSLVNHKLSNYGGETRESVPIATLFRGYVQKVDHHHHFWDKYGTRAPLGPVLTGGDQRNAALGVFEF